MSTRLSENLIVASKRPFRWKILKDFLNPFYEDTQLEDTRAYLESSSSRYEQEVEEIRRARIADAYPESAIPPDMHPLPREKRDIVSELNKGIEEERFRTAAESLSMYTERHGENSLMFAYSGRNKPSVVCAEGDILYRIGGGWRGYVRGAFISYPHNPPFNRSGHPNPQLRFLAEYISVET